MGSFSVQKEKCLVGLAWWDRNPNPNHRSDFSAPSCAPLNSYLEFGQQILQEF
jgi:hypothetical protein